ncbi:MAG: glycosyltransferase [Muribaculaceae bacterium]|nr:glycosyltransferase [Muribaculaceae bacterium]
MEDYKYKLSIIIPMYNAEKYIADCLDSILDSDLPKNEYEVIIVNDGSKDKGPEIAQKYVSKNDNFVYLTQENQGQSVARNYGIEESCGEYIWFLDSDDKIDQTITPIINDIEKLGKPEVFSFFLRYVSEFGKHITTAFHFPGDYNRLMSGRDAILSGFMPSSVCVYFMKRSFVIDNGLRFFPGIYHQDSEFSYKMMAKAKQVYFSEHVPYIYIKHPNSVVTSTSNEKILKKELDDIIIMNSFQKLASELADSDAELSKKINEHVDGMAFGIVYQMYKNRKEWKPVGINTAILSKLKEFNFYPLHIQKNNWKKWVLSLILNREYLINLFI